MDIAPTTLDAVGIQGDLNFADVSLINREYMLLRRKRYYYFYKKKKGHQWTDEMLRLVIEGGEIRKEKIIKLTNNPPKIKKKQ